MAAAVAVVVASIIVMLVVPTVVTATLAVVTAVVVTAELVVIVDARGGRIAGRRPVEVEGPVLEVDGAVVGASVVAVVGTALDGAAVDDAVTVLLGVLVEADLPRPRSTTSSTPRSMSTRSMSTTRPRSDRTVTPPRRRPLPPGRPWRRGRRRRV